MWEKLGFRGIDPSVISRVLKGERLFTTRQLEVLIETLKISKPGQDSLRDALHEEIEKRYGLSIRDYYSQKYFMELVEDNILKIRSANEIGYPKLAEEWSSQIYDVINQKINISNNDKESLFHQKGLLLLEILQIYFRRQKREYLNSETFKLAQELITIAEILKDKSLLGGAYFNIGNAMYVDGNLSRAREYLNKSNNGQLPLRENCQRLRSQALCEAFLGHKTEYLRMRKEINLLIDKVPPKISLQLSEGIARGDAKYKFQKEAYKALSQVKYQLDLDHDYLSELTYLRAEIELGIAFNQGRSYLSKISNKTLDLAENFGHVRYQQMMTKYLETFG